MSEVKSTAEACYDARMALIKERDELARQVSELQLSQQNIINAFGISGEGAHSKLVIEYVSGLVAEKAAISDRLQKLIQIVNNADNSYCMCGDSMKSHAGGGCGSPTGMFDYHYNAWLESEKEAPLTDAFTSELRAQGVGEFAADMWKRGNELVAEGGQKRLVVQVRLAAKLADTYVDNLRAGRKG